MLRGIDPLLSPDMLYSLAAMGHGDDLIVVDRNFPALSHHDRVHHLPGVSAVRAIEAVLTLVPLDEFVPNPLRCMQDPSSTDGPNEVQQLVLDAARKATGRDLDMPGIDRFEFYRMTRSGFAVIATGEDRPYGCFILSKGVLPEFGQYIQSR